MSTILRIVDNGNLPADVKTLLSNFTIDSLIAGGQSSGNDILAFLASQYPNNAAVQQALTEYRGKFVFPALTSTEVPTMEALVKMDGKAGLLTNFYKDELSGFVNLYWMHRTDYYALITQEDIVNKTDFKDKYKNKNTQTFIMSDIKVAHDWEFLEGFTWNAFGSVEEIKISRLSDNKTKAGDLRYGVDPLFRFQTGMMFRLGVVGVNAFTGFHKRSGYGFSDGLYVGLDGNVGVLGDRLQVQLRTLFDKEHWTLSPRLKLWFMQLEYSLKNPLRSRIDGVKPSAIHSLNVRFFI